MCGYVDNVTDQARFMFQIPDGHPGLSGLYVVAYIKIVDADSKATSTATRRRPIWRRRQRGAETGAGFAPGMYQVKSGVLYVKSRPFRALAHSLTKIRE